MGVGNRGDEVGMGRSMFGVSWGLGLVEGIYHFLREEYTGDEAKEICGLLHRLIEAPQYFLL